MVLITFRIIYRCRCFPMGTFALVASEDVTMDGQCFLQRLGRGKPKRYQIEPD